MYVHVVQGFSKPLTGARARQAIGQTASKLELHKVLEQHKALRGHWHFKRAAGSGTLEVTWDGTENKIRVIVHKNRIGADGWARGQAPKFAQTLASILGGRVLPQHVTNGH